MTTAKTFFSSRKLGLGALRRAQTHLDAAGPRGPLAAKVANALEHCIEFGADVYGPQLEAAVVALLAASRKDLAGFGS